MINIKRNIIISDLHGEFLDRDAFLTTLLFIKDYKPNNLIINGDLVDFYGLSQFDKNPDRKNNIQQEIDNAKSILKSIRKTVGNETEIIYLEGNHEARLQRYFWRNPELKDLDLLNIRNLLSLNEFSIRFIGVDNDYWKEDTGHYVIGDMLIMHGDSRLNGASVGKYSGYSVKNTMMNMQNNVSIGHGHKLALIHHTTPNGIMIGMETGCLCIKTGTANWQQGFVSFETYKEKTVNPRIYNIQNGTLIVDDVLYNKFGKNIL